MGELDSFQTSKGWESSKKRRGILFPSFWKTGCMPWHYQISWLLSKHKFFRKWLHNCRSYTKSFRLRILGNKKVFEKTQTGWRQMVVSSQLSRNKFLVIVVKIYTEADFKVSWYCPIFIDFFNSLPNILSGMVGVYYSWENIVNMSVASKSGDYIKKHLKISHQKI